MKKIILPMVVCGVSLFAQDIDYKYDFGARVEYDIGNIKLADETNNESKLRRARFSHEGSFYDKTIFYETEVDFSDKLEDNDEDTKFKDNYIGYKNKLKDSKLSYRFKLGNIKVPFSLDAYSGSKNSTFMESPLTDTLTQSRKIGIEGLFSKEFEDNRINLFIGSFKNGIDERRDDENEKQRDVIKTTYSYKLGKNQLIHLGGSYLKSDLDGDNVKYSQEAESSLLEDKYISTKVKNVNTTKDLSLEALYINDSFHFQTEYIQSNVEAESDDYTFAGYYAQVGYFLYGSSKKFKTASSKFSNKKIKEGDIELGLRYSYLDLNDKDETGGTQKDYNFAVNWHYNKNLKFMTNYIIAYPQSDDYDGAFSLVQARVALSF